MKVGAIQDTDPRLNALTERIIGAAIEVHRELGPGVLESAYEQCMQLELAEHGIDCELEVALPLRYKGVALDVGYRLDVLVEQSVIVELKTVESLLPIHDAQLLTYLRLTGLKVGLLINFNVPLLRHGVKRLVNQSSKNSAPPLLRGEI